MESLCLGAELLQFKLVGIIWLKVYTFLNSDLWESGLGGPVLECPFENGLKLQ